MEQEKTKKNNERILHYSMQLAMLRQLLSADKITHNEYTRIKSDLQRDYKIFSEIST